MPASWVRRQSPRSGIRGCQEWHTWRARPAEPHRAGPASSTAFATPSVPVITAAAPSKPTSRGSAATSSFTASVALPRWARLSALLFLYRDVLQQEVSWLDELVYAKRPHHLPVVLTRDEVRAVLAEMHGVPRLMALLLYGAGLRLRPTGCSCRDGY